MQDGTLSAEVLSLQKLKAELEELKKASMYHAGDVIAVEHIASTGFITTGTTEAMFFLPLSKSISSDVTSVRVSGRFRFRQNGRYIGDSSVAKYKFDTASKTGSIEYFHELGVGILIKWAGGGAFPNMTNNDCVSSEFYSIKIEFK